MRHGSTAQILSLHYYARNISKFFSPRSFSLASLLGGITLAAGLTPMAPFDGGSASAEEFNLPQGPGRSLVYARCRTCHDLQYVIESKGMTASAWDGLLDDMEGFGVELTPEERQTILGYLSAYMGDKPPPKPAEGEPENGQQADGAALFAENCTSCHQEDAQGIEDTFPPLANNSDLFLARDFPIKVLLFGMSGSISVNGAAFEGEMPSFAHLSDRDIAAVIDYLRHNFGNEKNAHSSDMPMLKASDVKTARQEELSPEDVLAYRAKLGGKTP